MWPWSRASCPLDPSAKAWVEGRLDWLRREFGDELFFERPLIQPTLEFFPELAQPGQANLENLFRRVCGYMQLDRERFELQVIPKATFIGLEDDSGHALGEEAAHYQQLPEGEVLRVREQVIGGPMEMVSILAHELSHARLLGEQRLDGRVLDNELLTDLTAVYHGFGIFRAQMPQTWVGGLARWPGTQRSMPRYMNSYMYGWALAHQAWLRTDEPTWIGLLPPDVRSTARDGLEYLRRTGDSALQSGAWADWDALHAALCGPCDP